HLFDRGGALRGDPPGQPGTHPLGRRRSRGPAGPRRWRDRGSARRRVELLAHPHLLTSFRRGLMNYQVSSLGSATTLAGGLPGRPAAAPRRSLAGRPARRALLIDALQRAARHARSGRVGLLVAQLALELLVVHRDGGPLGLALLGLRPACQHLALVLLVLRVTHLEVD